MTPAECVIDAFGGFRAAARAAGVAGSTVLRWNLPVARNGTGGRVPPAHWKPLLEAAKAHGKHLTEEHLRVGRPGFERRVIRMLSRGRNTLADRGT